MDHVAIQRLIAVATDDDLIFTLNEFNHLKVCSDCFRHWADIIFFESIRGAESE